MENRYNANHPGGPLGRFERASEEELADTPAYDGAKSAFRKIKTPFAASAYLNEALNLQDEGRMSTSDFREVVMEVAEWLRQE
jgi:hypothetical protein